MHLLPTSFSWLPDRDAKSSSTLGSWPISRVIINVSDMESDACCRCMTTQMQLLWMGRRSGPSGEIMGLLM